MLKITFDLAGVSSDLIILVCCTQFSDGRWVFVSDYMWIFVGGACVITGEMRDSILNREFVLTFTYTLSFW